MNGPALKPVEPFFTTALKRKTARKRAVGKRLAADQSSAAMTFAVMLSTLPTPSMREYFGVP